jgi:hypothetical protein
MLSQQKERGMTMQDVTLREVTLADKYQQTSGRVYISGIQALVRLPMMQRERDSAAGINTAGFISGYRGSPLGALDLELWRAQAMLKRSAITFQPGLNEDLAATRVWGSQQVALHPAKVQGAFGIWYGKGPGLDRTMDVFKHANMAGTARFGGVLAVAGDDHGCRSSTRRTFRNTSILVCSASRSRAIPGAGSASRPSLKRLKVRHRSRSTIHESSSIPQPISRCLVVD